MRFFRFSSIAAGVTALITALIAPSMAADDTARPAMWRAADADTEVFFLGTFHILPKGLDWRTEAFEAAFEKADTVYFEAETDAPDAHSKTLGVLMTEGFNPDGGLLSEMLDADDAASLRRIAASLGLPFAGVDPMRPWNAFLTLSVQFIVKQGFDPGSGVDSVLLKEARTKRKDVRFFETIEDQLELFTGLDPATEKALLVMTIREWDEQSESFDELFNAWREGDAALIDAEMNRVMRSEAADVYDRLIVNRNRAWADEIARVMAEEEGTFLVAVGAAHLVGEDSVQAMLEDAGYAATRYDAPAAANDNAPVGDDEIGALIKAVGED